MSDSSLSDADPDDAVLEQELRQVVARIVDSGKLEDLTVNGVRAAAQDNLGLHKGFFKEVGWKDKSKAIIESEVKRRDNKASSPKVSSPVKTPQKALRGPSRPTKRSSPDEPEPKKRRKLTKERDTQRKSKGVDTDSDEIISPRVKHKASEVKNKQSEEESSSLSDVDGTASAPEEAEGKPTVFASRAANLSESELSELVDDEPKPKGRKKGPSEGKPKKEAKKKGRKSAEKKDLDPSAEEIKRLQGWLIKCGIRKMWARELKPYTIPKEKIRHLKDLLADAGMNGRYSMEKASQIREARELQADLEAVQEGAKRWGKVSEGEEEEPQPQKKRSTVLPNFDFFESESE